MSGVCHFGPRSYWPDAQQSSGLSRVDPDTLDRWAEKAGRLTAELMVATMSSWANPKHSAHACLGVMRLGERGMVPGG